MPKFPIHKQRPLLAHSAHVAPIITQPRQMGRRTATEVMMRQATAEYAQYMAHVYGFPASHMSCGAICMPHRPEPPLRKTVHSTVVEPKQLT